MSQDHVRETASVLVVEDDPDIATALELILTSEGFRVRSAGTGERAIELCRHEPPDVILLDLMLPDMSGFEILKVLKRADATAVSRVIVLTARADEVDRILGFELGADDYVTKPFSKRELVLRVRAVLQRGAAAPVEPSPNRLRAGPIEIDPEMHRASVEGEPLELTLTEFRLLSELIRAAGRVRSRESLLSEIWGYDSEVLSRTVDTHVRRLRSKLGPAASWVVSIRGVGYRIRNPSSV